MLVYDVFMCIIVFGFVFVGGEGKCLMFFICDWVKFVVFFGGNYWFIDFALSNFVNVGFFWVVVFI